MPLKMDCKLKIGISLAPLEVSRPRTTAVMPAARRTSNGVDFLFKSVIVFITQAFIYNGSKRKCGRDSKPHCYL